MPSKEGHRRNRGKEGKVVPPRGSPESLPHLHELLESKKCLPPTINPRQLVLGGERSLPLILGSTGRVGDLQGVPLNASCVT